MNHKIAGPYYCSGRQIIARMNRSWCTVLTVDPYGEYAGHEQDALISDLIDFLTQRDKERAAGQSWNPGEYLKRRSR